MSNTINLNVSPYWDDFDPSKDYLRVLFRPGYPLQGRELNTLQSFLQEQIARHGNFTFKEGSRVIEGGVVFNNKVKKLTLTSSNNANYPPTAAAAGALLSNIDAMVGKTITNAGHTVKALVLTQPSTTTTTSTLGDLYVEYLTEAEFDSEGGFIYALAADNADLTGDIYNTYSATSNASLAILKEGIYYIREHFTRVPETTAVVSATSKFPSKEVGITVASKYVTQNDDASLYDIATGSPNEGAPGAHRFTQEVSLVVQDIDEDTSVKFYSLLKIVDGVVQGGENRGNPQLSELGKELARRTYDESGHYTVKPFTVHATKVLDSDEKYILNVSEGKAYVSGFEYDFPVALKIENEKELSTSAIRNHKIPFSGTSSIELASNNGASLPGWDTGTTSAFANRLLLTDASSNVIGICRAYCYQEEYSRGVQREKLYFYDAKFFQVLTLDSDLSSDLQLGNDVYNRDTRGYYYNEATDVAWLGANDIALINSNAKFKVGQPIYTSVKSTTATVTGVQNYDWTKVTGISGGAFVATVIAGSTPVAGSLLETVEGVVESARDAGGPYDNNVTFIQHTGIASGTPNGQWNEENNNDIDQVDKDLKFRYLHIKNVAGDRSNINYGWLAQDKQIHLGTTDVQKVYKVSKSADGTFASGQFERLNITTAGVIPQGSVLKGVSSGAEAVVALSNTTVVGLTDLSAGSGYHEVKSGTGSSALVEVVWKKNQSFQSGELLTVQVPAGAATYTALVTYDSKGTTIGDDYTFAYQLDDGQRNEHYDIGRLVRKPNSPAPNGTESLVVFFSYYEGDPSLLGYYNVDSYHKASFWTEDPRYYVDPVDISDKGVPAGVELRNCWDFRLKVQGAITDVTKNPFAFTSRGFYEQPRVKPKTSFVTDYFEYLARADKLVINEKGNFRIQKGKPAVARNAAPPSHPSKSMVVANIFNSPAERYPQQISIEVEDNKRYTMKDIGALDKRLSVVEDAVSLSILENQALNDNIEGERVGFITDDFVAPGSGGGEAGSKEFKASILGDTQEMVPPVTAGQPVDLSIASYTNIDPWYLANGRQHIVKAYDQVEMLSQLDVTGDYKINPFGTWTYQGEVVLTPAKQYWKETTNSYFTRLNGDSQPFNGDSEAFWALSRITEPDPNGFTETVRQWTGRTVVGRSTQTTNRSTTAAERARTGNLQASETRTVTRFRDNTTTATMRTFDTPVARGVETIGSRIVAPLPADHKMQPITVSYSATGLRPNTEHKLLFDGIDATDIIGNTLINTVSDDTGAVSGTFGIPRNTYNIGDHLVTVTSVSGNTSSYGDAIFNSSGHFAEQDVLLQQGRVTQEVSRSVVTGNTVSEQVGAVRSTSFFDPIAQTFSLPTISPRDAALIMTNQGGAAEQESFITSLDIWFTDIDARQNANKVVVQIREVVNGYPGGYDKVLGTAEVYVDRTAYQQTPGAQVTTAAKAVNFRFPNPIRLLGGKEYSLVLLTPSSTTKVCVAEVGQNKIGSNGIHDAQPNVGGHYGSFFISQNGETWTAEQKIDLTFKMYRADFGKGLDTPVDSTIVLQNEISNGHSTAELFTPGITPTGLRADIGNYSKGLCFETFENSHFVKVYHPNHGMNHDGALVVIWGVDQTNPNGTTKSYNGIPVSEIDLGVTESTFQTTTATHTVYYPTLDTYFIKTTTKATASGLINAGNRVCATQNIVYDMLISNINASIFDGTEVRHQLRTASTNSVDLEVLNNKINNAELAVVTQDETIDITTGDLVKFANPKIVRSKANASSTIDMTSTLTLSSANKYVSPVIPNGKNLDPIVIRCITGNMLDDSDIEGLTTDTITALSTDDQLIEHASYIAALESKKEQSAYVTKAVDLDIAANSIDVFFDADMQPGAEIEVLYKASPVSDDTPFNLLEWEAFPQKTRVNENNYGEFGSDTRFKQYHLHVPVGYDFDSFKVKLRMNCKNEAMFPTVKNLRIIGDVTV